MPWLIPIDPALNPTSPHPAAHGQDKLEGVDVEEVCADRPADEYFRLETDGDCREVYR